MAGPVLINDDLSGKRIRRFLSAHLQHLAEVSPPGCTHALNIDELQAPDVSFWSAWEGDALVGCGALKELDEQSGEIKSMRTSPEHLGKGVGRFILQHLVAEAKERGYRRILLETGSTEPFDAARALYSSAGFTYRGPFGNYVDDPFNRFMELQV